MLRFMYEGTHLEDHRTLASCRIRAIDKMHGVHQTWDYYQRNSFDVLRESFALLINRCQVEILSYLHDMDQKENAGML